MLQSDNAGTNDGNPRSTSCHFCSTKPVFRQQQTMRLNTHIHRTVRPYRCDAVLLITVVIARDASLALHHHHHHHLLLLVVVVVFRRQHAYLKNQPVYGNLIWFANPICRHAMSYRHLTPRAGR